MSDRQPRGAALAVSEMLLPGAIELRFEAASVEEVVREAGRLLLAEGAIEPRFVDAMWRAYQDLGPYMVLAPGVALLHARPEDGVLRTSLGWLGLAPPVTFGHPDNDPVDLAITLAALDSTSHVEALAQLAALLGDEATMRSLLSAEAADDVMARVRTWTATPTGSRSGATIDD